MSKARKTLSAEALAVLSDGIEVDGRQVRITQQLDRRLYLEVNGALEVLGGRWDRKARAHLFEGDPSDALDQVLVDGAYTDKRRELDQFFTPWPLAADVVARALVAPGMRVLEPSAGRGALVLAALRAGAGAVVYYEIDEATQLQCTRAVEVAIRAEARSWPGGRCSPCPVLGDFLLAQPSTYGAGFDRVIMNPPFSGYRELAHVMHAWRFVARGGRLVAIMSAGVAYRTDRRYATFRRYVEADGTIEPLPDGSFRESGTDVRTVLVTMVRA